MTINLRKESEDAVLELDIKLSKTISDYCNKLLELQNQIKAKKEELKKIEEEEKRVSQKVIPELMQQAGIKMLKLSSGAKVEIKDKFASVLLCKAVILTVPSPETVSPVIIAAVLLRVLPLLIDNPLVLS